MSEIRIIYTVKAGFHDRVASAANRAWSISTFWASGKVFAPARARGTETASAWHCCKVGACWTLQLDAGHVREVFPRLFGCYGSFTSAVRSKGVALTAEAEPHFCHASVTSSADWTERVKEWFLVFGKSFLCGRIASIWIPVEERLLLYTLVWIPLIGKLWWDLF